MRCSFEECPKQATGLAYSRKKEKVVKVCHEHALIIVEEDAPEYTTNCPHCGCFIPVN